PCVIAHLSLHDALPIANAAPPTEPSSAPPPSNLEAGGLRPPEAVDSTEPAEQPPGEAQVETELDKADSEDTGRGLEFVWLNGEVDRKSTRLNSSHVNIS